VTGYIPSLTVVGPGACATLPAAAALIGPVMSRARRGKMLSLFIVSASFDTVSWFMTDAWPARVLPGAFVITRAYLLRFARGEIRSRLEVSLQCPLRDLTPQVDTFDD
jgi:hypothetical protein